MNIKTDGKLWKIIFPALVVFVYVLFWRITSYTPLAGDDWGYALNGMGRNPFSMAYQFYFSWSGRYFSELWGFVIAQRKWLWNLLNPLLFAMIYYFSIRLSARKGYVISSALLFLVLMLNVSNQLRMETYTWIMGTTYVVPLLLSLIYFYVIEKHVYLKEDRNPWFCLITVILCFYISLTIENISAIMVFAIGMLLLSQYLKQQRINKLLLLNIVISLAGFIVMRMSPGSAYRYLTDNAAFAELGLIEKLAYNMPNFVQLSFMENKYLISILSLTIVFLAFRKYRNHGNGIYELLIVAAYELVTCVVLFSNILVNRFGMDFFGIFSDYANPLVWIYWITYVVLAFVLIIRYVYDIQARERILFFLLLGGASSVIMLMSPIFGARSVLYFTYYIGMVVVLMFNELEIRDEKILILLWVVSAVLIARKTNEYIYKYRLVNSLQEERLSIIQYYIDNPDIKEVHIPRMPPLTVHSADIEEYDTYHQEVFKRYYGLGEDCTLIFEWKKSYN